MIRNILLHLKLREYDLGSLRRDRKTISLGDEQTISSFTVDKMDTSTVGTEGA